MPEDPLAEQRQRVAERIRRMARAGAAAGSGGHRLQAIEELDELVADFQLPVERAAPGSNELDENDQIETERRRQRIRRLSSQLDDELLE